MNIIRILCNNVRANYASNQSLNTKKLKLVLPVLKYYFFKQSYVVQIQFYKLKKCVLGNLLIIDLQYNILYCI